MDDASGGGKGNVSPVEGEAGQEMGDTRDDGFANNK